MTEEAAKPPLPLARDSATDCRSSSRPPGRCVRDVRSDRRPGRGPVAIDAERASGYRYSQRAYLVQLRS